METGDEKKPDPLQHYPPRVRAIMRWTEVVLSIAAGQLGCGPGFEESVKKHYGTLEKFWQDALSVPLPASSFVDLIRRFHVEPEKPTDDWIALRIETLLKQASTMRQTWINRNQFAPDRATEPSLENFIVDPRRAAEWLFSMPRHRDLLPPSLQVFIEGQDARAPSAVTQGKRAATYLSAAIGALRELYGATPPLLDRKMIKRAVDQKTGHAVSPRTIDRARAVLWPKQ